jgi:hypothetical protein
LRTLSLCLLLSLSLTACGDKSDARRLALVSDRVAGYVSTGLTLIESQEALGVLTTDAAVSLVTGLRALNTVTAEIVRETRPLLDPATGELRLSAEDRSKLLGILSTGRNVISSLLEDSRVSRLPKARADQWRAVLNGLLENLRLVEEIARKRG